MVRPQLIAPFLALVLWATAALADGPLPALYDVRGVASDDVLNVRSGPSAQTRIVGALSFRARNVEVVRLNDTGRWGLVNTGEGSGWVSMRFLDRLPGQSGRDLPQPLTCFGTEPFWSATLEAGSVTLSTPDDVQGFDLFTTQRAAGRLGRYSFIATEVLRDLHGVVRRTACSDGMSDRSFGFDVDLILLRGSDASHLSGCCSVALN